MEPSNPEKKDKQNEEHETHTTALVFLVIASLIISYIALTYSGDVSDAPGESDQTPATTTHTSGNIVPQRDAKVTNTGGLSELPAGIYVEEDNITENQTFDTGNQIVRFTTDRAVNELYEEYRQWVEESEYELIQELEDEGGAKVVGSSDAGQITLSAVEDDEKTLVTIDYVSFE